MMSVVNQKKKSTKYCVVKDCYLYANFNAKNYESASHSIEHKEDDMIKNKRKCVIKDCFIRSNYNYNGNQYGKYCFSHKLEDMIDVNHQKCEFKNCKIRPNYNIEGEKAKYCLEHKSTNMVDVVYKRCIIKDCNKICIYNIKGKKPLYCSIHKLDNMIDVLNKKCKNANCDKRPSFNYEGCKTGLYCDEHKLDDMINIFSKKCEHEQCTISASFNFLDSISGKFCSEHKKDGMIIIGQKYCEFEGCHICAVFNFDNCSTGKFCFKHKLDGMNDVVSPKCLTPLCEIRSNNKYEGYCLRCFMYTFPDKPVSRNYKTKERAVVDYVYEHYPLEKYTWVNDRKIQGGCSYKRPDLLLDLGYQVLIIEIDENAHQQYDSLCDHKRTMELSQDVDHKPIIFIRFNPDKYIRQSTKITSCWKVNKNGICVIDKKLEWNERLEILNKTIEYWLQPNNISLKTITSVNLFFND